MEPIRKELFSRKWIVAFLVYIGLIAICCIAVYAVPSVKGILERTYIAEYGKVDVKDEVSAFIVRDETVYVAKRAAKIERVADANKLVKAGARVVKLTSEDNAEAEAAAEADAMTEAEAAEAAKAAEEAQAAEGGAAETAEGEAVPEETVESIEEGTNPGRYTRVMSELEDAAVLTEDGIAREAGYVSYYVDGAEAKLSTDTFGSLSKKDLKSLSGKRALQTPEHHCGKGYPIFKIVKNSKWYLVYYTGKENAERYHPGSYAYMDVDGDSVRVKVHSVEELEDESRVMLECKSFFDGFSEMKTFDAPITLASAEGLILKKSSIVENDGKQGVFAKNKLGEHVYKPISVIASDEDKCVVYSDIFLDADGNFVETIGTYDEIIEKPSDEDLASLKKTKTKKENDNQ